MNIILTDENEMCWKLTFTKDMKLNEILECVEEQFYPETYLKTKQKTKPTRGK